MTRKPVTLGLNAKPTRNSVIAKIEHLAKGHNPRFILTNLEGDAKALYDDIYCVRGDIQRTANGAVC